MAKGHPDLPKGNPLIFSKGDALSQLVDIDRNRSSIERVLEMETQFRATMGNHLTALPGRDSAFKKFNTSPFVLMIHSLKRQYSKVSEIENDILPAKEFSSMETSAGRMTEVIVLPIYEWEIVESAMHTANSALDGKSLAGDTLKLVTLKSGPRCLNDEMSENFADAIISNIETWAKDHGVSKVEFTYGVLYGTEKLSNKKDWHILRNLMDKLPHDSFSKLPKNAWDCSFKINDIEVSVTVRIGIDWWHYLGGEECLFELCIAMIRACVRPGDEDPVDYQYSISDLGQIIDYPRDDGAFNVSILQRSQIPWLFFILRHFCDDFSA